MILVGVRSAWIQLSLYTLLRNIRRFFRLLSRSFGKRMADAGSWLRRRSHCVQADQSSRNSLRLTQFAGAIRTVNGCVLAAESRTVLWRTQRILVLGL